ncbi:MAG: F420-nonreducing hydrogenase [Coriobacteriia bacterium]
MSKPRLATVVLGGCTGCHLSLLDAHEGLLELLGDVELVYSPLIDVADFPACDVAVVEGAVSTAHDEEVLRVVRAKAATLVAVGSCATLGGIGGLRNLHTAREVAGYVYGVTPETEVPALQRRVRPLSDIVEVDVSVPGCAPPTETLVAAVSAAVTGAPFELPRRNLCDECSRVHDTLLEHSKDFVSDGVYALMELETIDPERCFLEQGVICMGPMTREGCGSRCTEANVPCRGCMGPSRLDFEQGGKMVDVLAAILPAGAIMYMDDLIGTGYRFSMPVSIFPAVYDHEGDDDA